MNLQNSGGGVLPIQDSGEWVVKKKRKFEFRIERGKGLEILFEIFRSLNQS